MNDIILNKCISDCTERIENIKNNIDMIQLKDELKIYNNFSYEKCIDYEMSFKTKIRIKNFKNSIDLIKIEKLIYETIYKKNYRLLSLLKNKYANDMVESLIIGEEMVNNNIVSSQEYNDFSKQSISQKDYINSLCEDYLIK